MLYNGNVGSCTYLLERKGADLKVKSDCYIS